MQFLIEGVLIGIVATAVLDAWAAFARHVLRLPTAHWALVGRWFGHLARGVYFHRPISASPPVRHELALGWIGHYLIGMVYAVAYLSIVRYGLDTQPSLLSALVFGLATLFAPWLIMQPAMGAGVFARATPRPLITRLVNLSMHAVFGAALWLAWIAIDFGRSGLPG